MSEAAPQQRVSGANKIKLVLAWAFVSIPLIWGVYNTLDKAAQLFR